MLPESISTCSYAPEQSVWLSVDLQCYKQVGVLVADHMIKQKLTITHM